MQTIHKGKEQQEAFKEIKHRLIKPPVLYLLDSTGRFHLYSDTIQEVHYIKYRMENQS